MEIKQDQKDINILHVKLHICQHRSSHILPILRYIHLYVLSANLRRDPLICVCDRYGADCDCLVDFSNYDTVPYLLRM